VTNAFASALAAKPKVVFSSRIEPWPGWNTEVDAGDPCQRVRELLAGGSRHLVVQASPRLARTLRKAGLIDTLRLLLQPLVGGSGPSLFDDDEHLELSLAGSRVTASGAAALDYDLRPPRD
jgi:riboflavin biosynthesis pyrimidine reductase